MKRIIPVSEVSDLSQTVNKEDYSLIVPAAGRGSRLGFDLPKILYPILDRPILFWLLDLFEGLVSEIVLVLSPEGRHPVEAVLSHSSYKNIRIAIQEEPKGMAHAIQCAEAMVSRRHVGVVWGDQVGLQRSTIEGCFRYHSSRPTAWLTMPTIIRENPYISFERDADGRIVHVLEARELGARPPNGESDCGFFVFDRSRLFGELNLARQTGSNIGSSTGEANLLPLIPKFEGEADELVCIRTLNLQEAIGVNTPQEAEQVSRLLRP